MIFWGACVQNNQSRLSNGNISSSLPQVALRHFIEAALRCVYPIARITHMLHMLSKTLSRNTMWLGTDTASSVQEGTRAQWWTPLSVMAMAAQPFPGLCLPYYLFISMQFSVYIPAVSRDSIKALGVLCCWALYQLVEEIQYPKYLPQKAHNSHDLFGRQQ